MVFFRSRSRARSSAWLEILRCQRPSAGVGVQPVVERGVQTLALTLMAILPSGFPASAARASGLGEHARGGEELGEDVLLQLLYSAVAVTDLVRGNQPCRLPTQHPLDAPVQDDRCIPRPAAGPCP